MTRVSSGVRVHAAELLPEEIVTVEGIQTTSLARTVLDVTRSCPYEPGVVLADSALRAGLDLAELQRMQLRCRSWPGGRAAARSVTAARVGSESAGETRARIGFISQGLPEPSLQEEIRDHDGRVVARADFLFKEYATIGEFDGRAKYGAVGSQAAEAVWREKQREDRLRDLGFEVVRLVWADLYDMERTAARFRAAFARAAARGVRVQGLLSPMRLA